MYLGLPQSVYLHCLHGKNGIFQCGFLISDIGSIAVYSRHPDAFPKSNPPLQPVALLSVASYGCLRSSPLKLLCIVAPMSQLILRLNQANQQMCSQCYETCVPTWSIDVTLYNIDLTLTFSSIFIPLFILEPDAVIHHDLSRFPHKDLALVSRGRVVAPAVVHFNRVAPKHWQIQAASWQNLTSKMTKMTKHYIKIR